MKDRLIFLLVGCLTLVGLVGCNEQSEFVVEQTQTITKAFEDGDMNTINNTIFGTSEIKPDGKLSDVWGESTDEEKGVLACIFQHVRIEVKRVGESEIEYEIEAPNMKNVFADMESEDTDISEKDFLQYIKNYIQSAETMKSKVSLGYIVTENQLVVDYQNEEFINAVTGGILDAYKSLYSEILEKYERGEE